MIFLLDTHSLIWFALNDPRLSATAQTLIADPSNDVLISPASLWEIAIKVSIGKLPLNHPYEEFVAECLQPHMVKLLDIGPNHLISLISLAFPKGHKDPFDRLLIAQAMVENIPIISVDVAFDHYPVRRIW